MCLTAEVSCGYVYIPGGDGSDSPAEFRLFHITSHSDGCGIQPGGEDDCQATSICLPDIAVNFKMYFQFGFSFFFFFN